MDTQKPSPTSYRERAEADFRAAEKLRRWHDDPDTQLLLGALLLAAAVAALLGLHALTTLSAC
jgi:hypothetical protein